MSEHKNKNQQRNNEVEEEVFEGEVQNPEDLDDEEIKDVKAKDTGKKKPKKQRDTDDEDEGNFATRALERLGNITLKDVAKGALILGGGAALWFFGTKYGEKRAGDRKGIARRDEDRDIPDYYDDFDDRGGSAE